MNVKNFTLSDTIQEKPEEVSLHSGLAAHTADQRSCARSLVGLCPGPEQQSSRSVRPTVTNDAMTTAIDPQKERPAMLQEHDFAAQRLVR